MSWKDKNRKRYDALSDEDKTKLHLLAINKGYIKELPHKPSEKISATLERIDITLAVISATEEEWEQLFLLTTKYYKNYSYADLNKSLKLHGKI